MPTPYSPVAGRATPLSTVTARKCSSGIWMRMPEPSAVSGSAPRAPRWSRLASTSTPFKTMSCDRRALMLATTPTPQASRTRMACSSPRLGCAFSSARSVVGDVAVSLISRCPGLSRRLNSCCCSANGNATITVLRLPAGRSGLFGFNPDRGPGSPNSVKRRLAFPGNGDLPTAARNAHPQSREY